MTAIATPATRRTTAVSSLIDVCFIGQKSFPLHRGWDERLGILGFLLRRGELISLFLFSVGIASAKKRQISRAAKFFCPKLGVLFKSLRVYVTTPSQNHRSQINSN